MNTSVAPAAAGALAALKNLKSAVQNVKQSIVISGNADILKLAQDGAWSYGQENVEVEKGSRWAINPLSLRHGIVCWKVKAKGDKSAAELYGKLLVGAGQEKPKPTQAYDKSGDAVDHSQHPWVDCIGIDLVCVSGEDEGQKVIYEPTSGGGLKALDDYLDQLMKAPDDTPVAIIELDSDYYDNKTYGGKTYFPVFNYIDWVALDATAVPETPAEEGKSETTTEPQKAAAETQVEHAAASTASETEQPSGERRRRRRSA